MGFAAVGFFGGVGFVVRTRSTVEDLSPCGVTGSGIGGRFGSEGITSLRERQIKKRISARIRKAMPKYI